MIIMKEKESEFMEWFESHLDEYEFNLDENILNT